MSQDTNFSPSRETAPLSDGRIVLDAGLLKSLRKTRGLSQEALAELCFAQQLPVSIASIKRAETGKAVLYRTARHLATILEVDLDALTVGVEDEADAEIAPPPTPPAGESLRLFIALHIEMAGPPDAASSGAIADIVQHYGGTLATPVAGQTIALFGQAQAFGSDALRCLQCAQDLVQRLRVHGGRAMAMRLVQSSSATTAAGLPDLRQRGTGMPLYVARTLLSQLGSHAEFAEAEPPQADFLLFSALSGPATLAPLVGRQTETRQFKAVLEATAETQSGQVVYLRAQAGVGKSRLAQEFASLAREQGMGTHTGLVQDAGADSWRSPLEQLARSLFGVAPGAAGIEDIIDAKVAALHLPADWLVFYRAMTGARMNSEQMSLFAAMSHAARESGLAHALQTLITRMAMIEPLMLLVEDVHWGDAYLFEALGGLMVLSREAPVIWVLTSRIENDPLEAQLRSHLYELPLTVFDLAPMAARDAQLLADQYADVDADYRRRCVERAQGNALFLVQLLASPDDHLPASLKHLIQARLDALPEAQRRALRTAAVIGNRFELAMLREAIGDERYEPDSAGRNSLVRRVAPGTYAFSHDLVMHCIYESIEEGTLRRLHRVVANLLHDSDPASAAEHLYRADDASAFDMMLRAIRDKLAGHQYEDALDLSAQCSAHDSTRYSSFTLALLQAHATAGMGQMAQARERYDHALMLAGRPQEKIDAVIGLATTLNILDELDEEERLIDETLPLARSVNADASLAKLLYLKGNIYFPRGNFSECRRHHEEAVQHARASGMAETEARALSGLGDSYYAQGRMQKAYDVFSDCIGMCDQHGYLNIAASNRSALGSTRLYLGQPDKAVADALHSADLARKVGNKRAEIFSRLTAGWVLVATGDLERADDEVNHALDLTRAMGASRFEPFLMESAARIAWQRRMPELAEQHIMSAHAAVERQQLHRFIGPWILGTVALFTQDPVVRKKALLSGAAHLTRDCLAHNAYRFFVSAAEVSLVEGDTVSAEFYAGQLAGYTQSEPCAWVDHHVALIRAWATWIDAPSTHARQTLRVLQEQARTYGFTYATPRLHAALLELPN